MKWKPQLNAAENAHLALPRMAEEYFEAGRKAASHRRTPRELHRFRVKTKHFRYSLELFRPLFGRRLDPQIRRLQEVQRILGKMSDRHTIGALIEENPALARKLERSARARAKEFRKYWKDTFDAPHQLRAWKARLGPTPPS
jgi:CHAD domain-containing protein